MTKVFNVLPHNTIASYYGDTSFWSYAQKLAQYSALLSRCRKSSLVAYVVRVLNFHAISTYDVLIFDPSHYLTLFPKKNKTVFYVFLKFTRLILLFAGDYTAVASIFIPTVQHLASYMIHGTIDFFPTGKSFMVY